MSLIEWKPEYSVGNVSVDEEHRKLIGSINALHADLCEGTDRLRIVESLGEIYANIAAHFALEERMMREINYLEYRPHKDDHESLLDQLAGIIDAVEIEGSYDEHGLSSALDLWFSGHFRTHDARLHGELRPTSDDA